MDILLCAGEDGLLLRHASVWHTLRCPLAAPSLLLATFPAPIVADNYARLLAVDQQLLPLPAGVEDAALWRGHALLLSGDADSLTLADLSTGLPLIMTSVGVYPQAVAVLDNTAIVAGGADGNVRLLALPSLQTLNAWVFPGNVQRFAYQCGTLCVLSAVEDRGLCCLVSQLLLRTGRVTSLLTLRGLPGAVCGDGHGGWWVAASEQLCHFNAAMQLDHRVDGVGLPRHLCPTAHGLLITDPVLGALLLLPPHEPMRTLYQGDVRHALPVAQSSSWTKKAAVLTGRTTADVAGITR